ncbi:dockerin type I domain-containing protein [Lacipirellula sp.]|uniref:dockerin type I domain-containing protein n=1 Tax=Lacipirellula sp. TaxID=2691419 RepID=UPI003D0F73EB
MRFSFSGQRGMRLALAVAALSFLPQLSQAQTYNWNGGNGAYGTAGNWSPSGPPTTASNVFINSGTANYTSGDTNPRSVNVASTAGSSATLAITGGDIFADQGNEGGVRIGEAGTGIVTVNNATLRTGDGSIFVGGQNGAGTGTLTLSGAFAKLQSTDDFVLGRTGTGTFNMQGGYATADYTVIGKYGTGTWNQSGGAFVQTSGDFEIGDGGNQSPEQTGIVGPRTGTMNLTGGVLQSSGFIAISNRRGNGFVNVDGGVLAATGVVNNGAIIVGRGMDWDGKPGTGGVTEFRVRGGNSVVIANGDFEMNVNNVALSSTLVAQITGQAHTTIKVTGNAKIANGSFKVQLDGYAPVLGDSWTILSAGVTDLSAEKNEIDLRLAAMGFPNLPHATAGAVGTLQGEFKSTDFSLAPLSSGLQWDVAYANNSVVLSVVAGGPSYAADFNHDGRVDGLDLTAWKTAYGQPSNGADANGDGVTNGADFLVWQREFGSGVPATPAVSAVPEPASIALIGLAAMGLAAYGRARRS